MDEWQFLNNIFRFSYEWFLVAPQYLTFSTRINKIQLFLKAFHLFQNNNKNSALFLAIKCCVHSMLKTPEQQSLRCI